MLNRVQACHACQHCLCVPLSTCYLLIFTCQETYQFFNLACHWPKACQFLKLQINVPKSVPLFQLLRPKDMQNFQLFFKSKYFSIIYLIFANLVSCNYLGFPLSCNYLGFPTQADYNSRKSQYSHAFFILFSPFRCGKFEKPSLLAR